MANSLNKEWVAGRAWGQPVNANTNLWSTKFKRKGYGRTERNEFVFGYVEFKVLMGHVRGHSQKLKLRMSKMFDMFEKAICNILLSSSSWPIAMKGIKKKFPKLLISLRQHFGTIFMPPTHKKNLALATLKSKCIRNFLRGGKNSYR